MQQEKPNNKSVWWSWKMDEADLQNQVGNYNKLKITESYRGISVLIISALLGFSFLISAFGLYSDLGSMLWSLVIYAPVLFFVFKGHRWAIVALMVLWTFEKFFQIYQIGESGNGSVITPLFWWLIIMPYFWKALRVENAKRKIPNVSRMAQGGDALVYCHECGTQLPPSAAFCSKCGTRLMSQDPRKKNDTNDDDAEKAYQDFRVN